MERANFNYMKNEGSNKVTNAKGSFLYKQKSKSRSKINIEINATKNNLFNQYINQNKINNNNKYNNYSKNENNYKINISNYETNINNNQFKNIGQKNENQNNDIIQHNNKYNIFININENNMIEKYNQSRNNYKKRHNSSNNINIQIKNPSNYSQKEIEINRNNIINNEQNNYQFQNLKTNKNIQEYNHLNNIEIPPKKVFNKTQRNSKIPINENIYKNIYNNNQMNNRQQKRLSQDISINKTFQDNYNQKNQNEINNNKYNDFQQFNINIQKNNPLQKNELKNRLYINEQQNNPIQNNQLKNLNQGNLCQNNINIIPNQNNKTIKKSKSLNKIKLNNLDILYPHKTRLADIDNSSYLNAVIQCLSNIRILSDYLLIRLKDYQGNDKNKNKLTIAYYKLLHDLFYAKEKVIYPFEFMQIINDFNIFSKNDPRILIGFILEKLNEELTSMKVINNNNLISRNDSTTESDTRNKTIMFRKFYDKFKLKNKSIISDKFYGAHCSEMKCLKCGIIKYSFKEFHSISFNLNKIQEHKNKELGFYNNIDLYDAFFYNQREKEIVIYCNNCESEKNGKINNFYYCLNSILILCLYFKEEKDKCIFFEYPEILDFSKLSNVEKVCNKFFLYSIICLIKDGPSSYHYITLCRNDPKDNMFFCYDNEKEIYIRTFKDSISMKFNGESNIGTIIPYILIYQHLK